ncbi:hypothetical protein VTK56DRAFT_769 [Thermocarpiscus australiensis]
MEDVHHAVIPIIESVNGAREDDSPILSRMPRPLLDHELRVPGNNAEAYPAPLNMVKHEHISQGHCDHAVTKTTSPQDNHGDIISSIRGCSIDTSSPNPQGAVRRMNMPPPDRTSSAIADRPHSRANQHRGAVTEPSKNKTILDINDGRNKGRCPPERPSQRLRRYSDNTASLRPVHACTSNSNARGEAECITRSRALQRPRYTNRTGTRTGISTVTTPTAQSSRRRSQSQSRGSSRQHRRLAFISAAAMGSCLRRFLCVD